MRNLMASTFAVCAVFVSNCGPVKMKQAAEPNAEETKKVTDEDLGIRADSSSVQTTVAELASMNLPLGRWADDPNLVYEIASQNTLDDYSIHCPNYDIDGNGAIEYIATDQKDSSGQIIYKGDIAILLTAIMNRAAGNGWPSNLDTLAGPNPKRHLAFPQAPGGPYMDYLNCLVGAASNVGYSGPNRLDLNQSGSINMLDAVRFLRLGKRMGPLGGIPKTLAGVAAKERLNADVKVCLAYFKFKNESNARIYQADCNTAPYTTLRRMPDLTVEKVGNACEFRSEGASVRQVRYNAALCGP